MATPRTTAALHPTDAPHPIETPRPTEATSRGPLLVATDGRELTDAAFTVAAALVADRGGAVEVLSVFEPVIAADIQYAPIPALPAGWYAEQKTAAYDAVKAQLARTVGADATWPVTPLDGEPASALAIAARERGARLLLVGRGRHGWLERVLGGETVLRLLRAGETPVLAVEPTQHGRFRRAVIATDFSPQSVHAARVALDVLAPDAHVTLVNVQPRLAVRGPEFAQWRRMYEQTLPAAFAAVQAAMAPPATMTIETVSLEGDAARALLEFARTTEADLVVSATHGYGFLHRLVVGSVATELLRGAPCSFLCVPGSALLHASARTQLAARFRTERFTMEEWGEVLATLTDVTRGRTASLELDLIDGGAQVVLSHAVFQGSAFEAAGARVQLMFGATTAPRYHLTHTIDGVTGIDLLRDAQDVPRVVRFTHDDGQTLLTFEA